MDCCNGPARPAVPVVPMRGGAGPAIEGRSVCYAVRVAVMDARELFIDIVSKAPGVPAQLAAHAVDVRGCEQSSFDSSYMEFLDTQIRLGARGPEWTERLARRRMDLSPYRGIALIRGSVRSASADYTVYVDANRRNVVFWEEYELDGGGSTA